MQINNKTGRSGSGFKRNEETNKWLKLIKENFETFIQGRKDIKLQSRTKLCLLIH